MSWLSFGVGIIAGVAIMVGIFVVLSNLSTEEDKRRNAILEREENKEHSRHTYATIARIIAEELALLDRTKRTPGTIMNDALKKARNA